jgi:hypothetical protein
VKIRSIGIPHPAAILRGGFGLEPAARRALRRLVQDVREPGLAPDPTDTTPPPGSLIFPTPTQIETYLTDPRMRAGVAVDIETAGPILRCVGFCRLVDPAPIVCWFHFKSGQLAWEDHREHTLVYGLVARCLSDAEIPKVFQNGQQFDVGELRSHGFTVNGYADLGFDTMLAHRHALPEAPASLQWMTCNYVRGARPWKHWIGGKEEEDDNK